MLFKQFEDKGLSQFSYFIGCEKTKIAAVIDPRRDVDIYEEFARENKMEIGFVFETHIHADYASGAKELANRTGARLMLSAYDDGEKYEYSFAHEELRDGDIIELETVRFKVLHTPGHTPEHISFLVYDLERTADEPQAMLSGDFLFIGSLGRPDLLGEDDKRPLAQKLYKAVNTKLKDLHDDLEIFPGHGAGSLCGSGMSKSEHSTLGFERKTNPYLQGLSESEFLDKILGSAPPFPKYYLRMKEQNAAGPAILGEIKKPKAMDVKEFASNGCFEGVILDTRHPISFGGAHLEDSINIGMIDSLSFWAAWVLEYDRPIYLVVEDEDEVETVVRSLVRVGLDDVKAYLKPGISGWIAKGEDFMDIPQVSVRFLDDMIDAGEKLTVLDLRSDAEWNDGHIKGARHIYLGNLQDHIGKLPIKDDTIFCICGGGFRSSIACSILQKEGFEMVYNVMGGMAAWKAAGFSVTNK